MKKLIVILHLIALLESKKLTEEENEKRLEQCGKNTKNKIFNGGDVNMDEAPWAVLIHNTDVNACSGTLISPRHVLTASHCAAKMTDFEFFRTEVNYTFDRSKCLDNDNFIIPELMASKIYIVNRTHNFLGRAKFLIMFQFCRRITDKNAYQIQYPDDLMIIELSEDLEYTSNLQPVCIARDLEDNPDGKRLMFYGFGDNPPPNLEEAPKDQTIKRTLRKEETRILKNNKEGTLNRIDPRIFQCRSVSETSVTCPGDSGGGAISVIDGQRTVVGVLSRSSCRHFGRGKNASEIFAAVGYYSEDICKFTGICNPPRDSSIPGQNVQVMTVLISLFLYNILK